MNNPEYIVVDEIGLIVAKVKDNLALPMPAGIGLTNLNYQYGYIKELDDTLRKWSGNPLDAPKRFPLVWLEQPFNIDRGKSAAFYGTIDVFRVFIINATDKNWTAPMRMTNNFKPVIHPIKREFISVLNLSTATLAFSTALDRLLLKEQDRYYWGENQASVLEHPVDCTILTIRELQISNNPNCTPG